MNYSNYPFTLDIHSVVSQISFPVSLNDTARSLIISLTDGGRPYEIADGCRAVLAGVKPDGTRLLNDCIIVGNKIIRYDFTKQTTSVVGKADCEIRLYGVDGKIIASPRFTIVVYENLLDERIVSEDEKTTIDNMLVAEQLRVAAENERVAAEAEREEVAKRAEAAADRVKESLNGDRVYIRYSAYPDGEGYVSEWSRGLNYIGVAAGLDEPTDKSGYEWSIFAPTVYVGSGDMPDYADIQIDPDSEDVDYAVVQEMGDSEISVMSQKATTEAIEEAKASSAAPLQGYATGAIVCLDDVPQDPQKLRVKVESKNLIPHPFTDTTKTVNGVTWTDNGDGTVTANGTSTNYTRFFLCEFTAEKSGTYTLSGCPTEGLNGGASITANVDGLDNLDVGAGKSFHVNAGDLVKVDIVVISPVVTFENVTFKPQLEFGEQTAFTPYASPSGATVVAYGKNLFDISKVVGRVEATTGGSLMNNQDGSIAVVLGSQTSVYGATPNTLRDYAPGLKVGETYTISAKTTGTGKHIYLNNPSTQEPKFTWTWGKPVVMTEEMLNARVYWYASGAGTEVVISDVQIEQGANDTAYEPFTLFGEYTADEDGVAEIPSVSPYMYIAPKATGHMLSVTYNRDLGEVITRIENTLAELSDITNTLLGG